MIRPGVAAAGAIETGERVRAALRERLSQHVARPGAWPAAPAGIGTGSIGHQLLRGLFRLGRTAIGAGGEPRLDRVPDRRREIDAVEPGDLLDAGRRGHVDLGHVIADDVDADKYQPLLSEARPDRGADVALAGGQLGFDGP